MMRVVDYCQETYGSKIYIQSCDLREVGSDFAPYIVEAGTYTWTGYQMYGGREWLDATTGDRMAAFKKGLANGIVFCEVYRGDLLDPTLDRAIRFLADGLATNAKKNK